MTLNQRNKNANNHLFNNKSIANNSKSGNLIKPTITKQQDNYKKIQPKNLIYNNYIIPTLNHVTKLK